MVDVEGGRFAATATSTWGVEAEILGFFTSKMGVQYGLTNKSRVQNQP
jgi:hypothetical protein